MTSSTRSDGLRQLADFLDEHPIEDLNVHTMEGQITFHAHTIEAAREFLTAIGPEGWSVDSISGRIQHDTPIFGFPTVALFVPPPTPTSIPAEILAVLA